MLDTASDAVISFDESARLTYWNPAAERMFGCSSAQALGQPAQRFLPIPGLEAAEGSLQRLRDSHRELFSGEVLAIETRDAAGEPLPVEVALTAYLNGLPSSPPTGENCTAMATTAHAIVLEYTNQQPAIVYARNCAWDHDGAVRYHGDIRKVTAYWSVTWRD